jgi:hypothetical protein
MSYSVPQSVDALGPLTALALGAIVWLMLIGTPVLLVLAIRFLWYRHVYVGRSAELDKLIWQLHRVASALETQSATKQPTETPHASPEPRPVAHSMFGR